MDRWSVSGWQRCYVVHVLIVDGYLYFRIHDQDACGPMPGCFHIFNFELDIGQRSCAGMILKAGHAVLHQHNTGGRFANK